MNLFRSLACASFCLAVMSGGCSVGPIDDFLEVGGSSGVAATVTSSGSGTHQPPGPYVCGQPAVFHAVLKHNGELLRSDADGPTGPVGDDTLVVEGVIEQTSPGVFAIDTCVTACMPADVYELSLPDAAGGACVHDGAFVQMKYITAAPHDGVPASYAVTVETVASLHGYLNPFPGTETAWFEGMHGVIEGTWFTPSLTPEVTCNFTDGTKLEGHDLVLTDVDSGSAQLQLGTPFTYDDYLAGEPMRGVFTDLSSVRDPANNEVALDFAVVCLFTPQP